MSRASPGNLVLVAGLAACSGQKSAEVPFPVCPASAATTTIGTPVTLVSGLDSPEALTVSGTSLYFSVLDASYNSFLVQLPVSGGTPSTLTENVHSFAADDTRIYWFGGLDLLARPTAGGPIQTLASSVEDPADALVVDASGLYWIDEALAGGIDSLPLAGGTPSTITTLSSEAETVTASRTLWVLHLDSPDDPRFPAALELLHEGRAIGYRGISISLDGAAVRCCAPASWRPEALTEQRALADFDEMQKTIEELRELRPDFDAATRPQPARFALVDDYGTGVVELCHLADGKVVGLSQS